MSSGIYDGDPFVSSERNIDKKLDQFDQRLEEMGIRIKDADQLKVREDVFDDVTLLALYKLVHKKWFSVLGGSISTGKEANVFYAERDGVGVAIKIYRIRTANFTTMSSYITGDRRFSHVKKAKKELIFAWTRKEFSNLVRARDAGIACSRTPCLGPEHPDHVLPRRGRDPLSATPECSIWRTRRISMPGS